MPLKLLLTDSGCALGLVLEQAFEREDWRWVAPDARLNWRSAEAVAACIQQHKPDLVINTLGGLPEPDPDTLEVLPTATGHLAAACQPAAIPLIHFSSYRVFGSGSKNRHAEKDTPDPVSDLGRRFLAAEKALEPLPRHIILRLSWLFGSEGDNLLTRLLEPLMTGAGVRVSTRLQGAPTAYSDVARVTQALIKQILCGAENWGVMHYASSDTCSHAEFADQVIHSMQQLDLLTGEPQLESVETLPRDEPASAVLASGRIRDNFGVQPRSWRPSLASLIEQWANDRKRG